MTLIAWLVAIAWLTVGHFCGKASAKRLIAGHYEAWVGQRGYTSISYRPDLLGPRWAYVACLPLWPVVLPFLTAVGTSKAILPEAVLREQRAGIARAAQKQADDEARYEEASLALAIRKLDMEIAIASKKALLDAIQQGTVIPPPDTWINGDPVYTSDPRPLRPPRR